MPIEIICSLIALAGVIVSGVVSFVTARISASREINRLKLEWSHQSEVTYNDAVSKMSADVSNYLAVKNGYAHQDAVKAVAALKPKTHDNETSLALDRLEQVLLSTKDVFEPDEVKIKTALSYVIISYRKAGEAH